jgi:hypothetical protein
MCSLQDEIPPRQKVQREKEKNIVPCTILKGINDYYKLLIKQFVKTWK